MAQSARQRPRRRQRPTFNFDEDPAGTPVTGAALPATLVAVAVQTLPVERIAAPPASEPAVATQDVATASASLPSTEAAAQPTVETPAMSEASVSEHAASHRRGRRRRQKDESAATAATPAQMAPEPAAAAQDALPTARAWTLAAQPTIEPADAAQAASAVREAAAPKEAAAATVSSPSAPAAENVYVAAPESLAEAQQSVETTDRLESPPSELAREPEERSNASGLEPAAVQDEEPMEVALSYDILQGAGSQEAGVEAEPLPEAAPMEVELTVQDRPAVSREGRASFAVHQSF